MSTLTFILLLATAVILSVIFTVIFYGNHSYDKGHKDGFEDCKRCTTIPHVVWDLNNIVHRGICPTQNTEIFEKEHTAPNGLDKIPYFGINIKYKPNDEKPNKREFLIQHYCDLYPNQDDIHITPEGVSDGFHTFTELYEYRRLYNATLINTIVALKASASYGTKLHNYLKDIDVIKSKRHFGGEKCYGGGWFIVMIKTPYGQISNHYKLEHWDEFKCRDTKVSWKWDGHGMKESLTRLNRLGTKLAELSK